MLGSVDFMDGLNRMVFHMARPIRIIEINEMMLNRNCK